MNLNQTKLTRQEWESIETPISLKEKDIVNFIVDCYETNQLEKKESVMRSVCQQMKLNCTDVISDYCFLLFFSKLLNELRVQFEKSIYCSTASNALDAIFKPTSGKQKIKTSDKIRISTNSSETLENACTYEFVLIRMASDILNKTLDSDIYKALYSLNTLLKLDIPSTLKTVKTPIQFIFDQVMIQSHIVTFVKLAKTVVEQNTLLLKIEERQLYRHQKQLFETFQSRDHIRTTSSKLVFYVASTGTGKTLSPIALCSQYRVIFVCAARHVGLSLAKTAISTGKKVAFGFGCEDTSDIRLHNSSAVKFETDLRTGKMYKIDHSIGTKVELLICDLNSYLFATYYMKAFNPVENIITFWDEPTITLDKEDDPLHVLIQKNWSENTIPNMILSSATFPKLEHLGQMISGWKTKFPLSEIVNIQNADYKKNISILNTRGQIVSPHFIFETYEEVLLAVKNCETNPTLLRYVDLESILKFLDLAEESGFVKSDSLLIENVFQDINDVTIERIKLHYLNVLKNIKTGCWGSLFLTMKQTTSASSSWGILLTTNDAYTITDGPALFLAQDTNKIASFFIQQSKIPAVELQTIMTNIENNNQIFAKLKEFETKMETESESIHQSKGNDREKPKKGKCKEKTEQVLNGFQTKLKDQCESLRIGIRKIELNELYVPNKPTHLKFWSNLLNRESFNYDKVFSGDIDQTVVAQIMQVKVSDEMKFLLLMGIGLLSGDEESEYTEIIKSLISQQKLYIIIANSDYIYGTNYQFCHAYLSKDLELTQEKMIQCLGRVGRNNIQQQYSIRLRDDKFGRLLFLEETRISRESYNMNRLFS